jgi:hypothetical protein
MSENDKIIIPIQNPISSQTYSRSVRLEDFLDSDGSDDTDNKDANKNSKNKNNNYNYNKYDNTISKNQKEFGHRMRIKP